MSCAKALFSQRKVQVLVTAFILSLVYLYLSVSTDSEGSNIYDDPRIYNDISFTNYVINTSTCKIPDLDPWHASIKYADLKCSEDDREPRCSESGARDWLYSNGSHLIQNFTAINAHGYSENTLRCCYRVIERVEQTLDNYDINADLAIRLSDECHPVKNAVYVSQEFVKAFCISTSFPIFEDVVYREYFAFVRPDARAEAKITRWNNIPISERPPNIILIGIDTNSRLNSRRQLHQTLKLLRKLGAVEMLGYTKIGENTFPNTVPFFTGISEEEMKPYCYSSPADAQDDCPYIFKDFDRAGYITATVDDSPLSTSFNYMKTGFVHKPTDFYYRPFTLGVLNQPRESAWYVKCIGRLRCDEVQLNYIRDILKASKGAPTFIHSWSTTFTHGCIHHASFLDIPMANFIHDTIATSSNTLFIFMSDHGDRFGRFRETTLGWYEDKLPTMWIYMTPDLKAKFPKWDKAIKINSKRLTSHFDLHHTMIQILATYNKKLTFNESYENSALPIPRRWGQTMLEPLPENRTCEQAGIPRGYCACTEPQNIDTKSSSLSIQETLHKIATTVLTFLRQILPNPCATPTLKEIVAAKHLNEIGGNSSYSSETYVLSLYTNPGNFLFEATVKASLDYQGKGKYSVESLNDILRMNKMNRRTDCVDKPDIERYCYCK